MAHHLYTLASTHFAENEADTQRAQRNASRVAAQLTPDDLKESRKLTSQWEKLPPARLPARLMQVLPPPAIEDRETRT